MVGVGVTRHIWCAATSCGTFAIGMGGMSVFVDAAHLGLLVAMSGMAAISAVVLTKSIEEEDAGSSWIWGSVFVATSFGVAWSFWTLS